MTPPPGAPTCAPARPRAETGAIWYDAWGYRCAVASPAAVARRLLGRLYAPFRTDAPVAADADTFDRFHVDPPAVAGEPWRLRRGGALLHQASTVSELLQQLEYELCLRVMAHRPDLLPLHTATVFSDSGRAAALLTGPSGAGKTTLALALGARGYRVGGDDIALIDPRTGRLWPLPRCFHLDDTAWGLVRDAGLRMPADSLRHRFLTPADLGETALHAAPVRHVFLAARGDGPTPRLEPLPLSVVALALLPQLRGASEAPAAAVATLAPLLAGAAGYRLTGGALGATVDAIAGLLGSTTRMTNDRRPARP